MENSPQDELQSAVVSGLQSRDYMPFCGVCSQSMGNLEFRDEQLFSAEGGLMEHHDSIPSFLGSAEEGCYICSQALHTLSDENRDRLRHLASLWPSYKAETPPKKGVWDGVLQTVEGQGTFFTRLRLGKTSEAVKGSECLRVWLIFNAYHKSQWLDHEQLLLPGHIRSLCDPKISSPHGGFDYSYVFITESGHIPAKSLLSTNTWSDESVEYVTECMRECTSTHQRCRDRRESPSYPTRLVDVGVVEGASDGTTTSSTRSSTSSSVIRLVRGQDLAPGQEYTTLSHQWGSCKVPLLTMSNIADWHETIPLSEFSKTYLDAFEVTRFLGTRYIWIDSLCIIQEGDGKHDWSKEASMMSQYYKNGLCNISADWATADEPGLFRERDRGLILQTHLDLQSKFDSVPQRLYSLNHRLLNIEVNLSPLNQRAWVFQERVLAARIIHFCRGQIFWECCQDYTCETYPKEMPQVKYVFSRASRMAKKFEPNLTLTHKQHLVEYLGRPLNDTEKCRLAWSEALHEYSFLDLTYPGDRLVAVAGIAAFVAANLKDQYIAGLWASTLVEDLCWSAQRSRLRPRRRQLVEELAPSFSWASLDDVLITPCCQATFFGSKKLVSAHCIEYRTAAGLVGPSQHPVSETEEAYLSTREVTLPTDRPIHGNILGPYIPKTIELRLRGTLKSMRLEYEDEKWFMVPDCELNPPVPQNERREDHRQQCWLDFQASDGEVEKLQEERTYYMPLTDAAMAPRVEGQAPKVAALFAIMLRLEDASMGRFRRIGSLTASGYGDYEDFWEMFIKNREVILKEQAEPQNLPCWRYDAALKQHTIYVV